MECTDHIAADSLKDSPTVITDRDVENVNNRWKHEKDIQSQRSKTDVQVYRPLSMNFRRVFVISAHYNYTR